MKRGLVVLVVLLSVRLIAQTPSPSGTTIPPATQIVDSTLAVWTLSSPCDPQGNCYIYRNGMYTAGNGSILYYANSTIYTLGDDNNWWQYTGDPNAAWTLYGPDKPTNLPVATIKSKLDWMQPADSLNSVQGYIYRTYIDQFPVQNLTGVSCTDTSNHVGPWPCVSNFPPNVSVGQHSLTLTAYAASQNAESPKSNSVAFTFSTNASDEAAPTNIHIK